MHSNAPLLHNTRPPHVIWLDEHETNNVCGVYTYQDLLANRHSFTMDNHFVVAYIWTCDTRPFLLM